MKAFPPAVASKSLSSVWGALGKAQNSIEIAFNWIAAFCVAILMFLTVSDFIGRYTADYPIPGAGEIGEHLMVAIVFLAFAYTQFKGGHIKVEAATQLMPKRVRAALEVLGLLLGVWLFSMITWRSGIWMWESWATKEFAPGLLSFPVYPAKTALVVGSAFLALRYLVGGVRRLNELVNWK